MYCSNFRHCTSKFLLAFVKKRIIKFGMLESDMVLVRYPFRGWVVLCPTDIAKAMFTYAKETFIDGCETFLEKWTSEKERKEQKGCLLYYGFLLIWISFISMWKGKLYDKILQIWRKLQIKLHILKLQGRCYRTPEQESIHWKWWGVSSRSVIYV